MLLLTQRKWQRRKKMAKAEKDPFEVVPDEFKDAVAGMNTVEIKQRIAQVALDQVELMKAKKEDQDLLEKREIYKEAGALYREGTKLNRTKIEYCKMTIDSKGGK
jgi:hypothetical protein